jgi:prevent-host-death family protein
VEKTNGWSVAQAKARFSELIESALNEGPQVITRNGVETAIVVSIEEWEKKTKRKGTLAEFFANSPLRNSGLSTERTKDRSRPIKL